jgi:hypothetical protein
VEMSPIGRITASCAISRFVFIARSSHSAERRESDSRPRHPETP